MSHFVFYPCGALYMCVHWSQTRQISLKFWLPMYLVLFWPINRMPLRLTDRLLKTKLYCARKTRRSKVTVEKYNVIRKLTLILTTSSYPYFIWHFTSGSLLANLTSGLLRSCVCICRSVHKQHILIKFTSVKFISLGAFLCLKDEMVQFWNKKNHPQVKDWR